jgi:glutathione S-transferase
LQAQTADKQKEALEDLIKAHRTFAEKVKGPYFLGEQFSIVDIAVAPWIVRDYILKENRGYEREAVSPEWKKYADNLEKRPTIAATTSVSSLFIHYSLSVALNLVAGEGILRRDLRQVPA